MKKKSRIVIVEDHPIVRRGLKQLIEMEDDLTVSGEAENAVQAVDLITKMQPDLAIVDISLKAGSGLELIKNIVTLYPDMIILVVSMHDECFYAERVIRAGAMGYIMKSEAYQNIMLAIRKVLSGDIYLSDAIRNKILKKLLKGQARSEHSPLEALSDREAQVFQLIAEGNRTSVIAEKLNLSISTIDTHYTHIKKKLGLNDTTELVQYAVNWLLQEGKNGSGSG
ncbi:MAG: response regulator transcription factor [Spirochaetales bacterium]|nr:response regulator transcription factor [Spirochaetales bacterium]